jgi:tripartite-type tricarboxylate transporter receptor subunit TctC
MVKVLADNPTQQLLVEQGVELWNVTPAQFATQLQEDIGRWAKIVKASGATVD